MTKNYYRDEYTKQQWIALIDKAIEFGCKIEYSKYGNTVTIDSTDFETILMKNLPNTTFGKSRDICADEIHRMIQDAAERVK